MVCFVGFPLKNHHVIYILCGINYAKFLIGFKWLKQQRGLISPWSRWFLNCMDVESVPCARTDLSTLRLLMLWLRCPLSRKSKVYNFLVRESMYNMLFAGNESMYWRMITTYRLYRLLHILSWHCLIIIIVKSGAMGG